MFIFNVKYNLIIYFCILLMINGCQNTTKKLIVETNVGVAPGIAFGDSGEGYLRICFAAKKSFIHDIMNRLEPILNKN